MDDAQIESLNAMEVLDSRGNPTLRIDILLSDGTHEAALVPSGASKGKYEALELRDGVKGRYGGRGVLVAADNVNEVIKPVLLKRSPFDQNDIDTVLIELDGTRDKSNLGANATLGVSLAVARVAAASRRIPLYKYLSRDDSGKAIMPVPMLNVINGGRHASGSGDVQEFMIVPAGFSSFKEALRCGAEVYQSLKGLLEQRGYSTNLGDEGGFAPALGSNEAAIEMLIQAITVAGYSTEKHCFIALDIAATELFQGNQYVMNQGQTRYSKEELIDYYSSLVKSYPIISIEDGLEEDDWDGWTMLTKILGNEIQIVGDDLFTTNKSRILEGSEKLAANALLTKFNQIGTLTETFQAVEIAQAENWGVIISHRSGETEDTTIADLAVATRAGQIKAGAPCRSERVAKYNRLLKIEDELGVDSEYAGTAIYNK